jgi:hypothetical protein
MSLSITTYILDGKGRIISINGPWDEFAHENGGVDIYANDIQGQLIWDFISGDATRMWFDTLINFAAIKNEIIKRPYRCDSPEFKRYMRMTITPEGNGLLRIDHELLSLEQRKIPYIRFTNRKVFRISVELDAAYADVLIMVFRGKNHT